MATLNTMSQVPTVGTRMQLPIFPAQDNDFAVQPVSVDYLNCARAVATSLFYRFTGINTGYGYYRTATDGQGAGPDVATALRNHPTPLHYVQVVLAQWLLVMAGAREKGVQVTLTSCDHEAALKTSAQVNEHLSDVAKGRAFPTLSAVLMYLCEWYGTVVVSTCEVTAAAATAHLGDVQRLRVDTLPAETTVRQWYDVAEAMTPRAFVSALNAILSSANTAHPCLVAVVVSTSQCMQVRVRDSTSRSKNAVFPASDAAQVHTADQTTRIPTHVSLDARQAEELLRGRHALVVCQNNSFWPVLCARLPDPVLLPVAMGFAAQTLATAGQDSAAVLELLTTWLPRLFPMASDEEVTKAVAVATTKSTTEAAAAEKPVAEKPVAEKPAAEKPAAEKPAAEKALAPRYVVPGRLVRMSSHASASVINLAFSPRTWGTLQDCIRHAVEPLDTHETWRTKDGRTVWMKRSAGQDDVPDFELVKPRGQGHYEVTCGSVPVSLEGAFALTQRARYSVLVMREDLLWVALHPDGRVRDIVRKLWSMHERHVCQRNFDDHEAERLIQAATEREATDPLPHAAYWREGVMLELLFPADVHANAFALVAELESFMSKTAVAEVEGDAGNPKLAWGERANSEDLRVTQWLHADDDGTLTVRPVAAPVHVVYDRIVAWTETLLRCLVLTTTQLAVLCGVGSHTVRHHLRRLALRAQGSELNEKVVSAVLLQDQHEVLAHLNFTPGAKTSSDGASLLSS